MKLYKDKCCENIYISLREYEYDKKIIVYDKSTRMWITVLTGETIKAFMGICIGGKDMVNYRLDFLTEIKLENINE